jgi:hypothetical protein
VSEPIKVPPGTDWSLDVRRDPIDITLGPLAGGMDPPMLRSYLPGPAVVTGTFEGNPGDPLWTDFGSPRQLIIYADVKFPRPIEWVYRKLARWVTHPTYPILVADAGITRIESREDRVTVDWKANGVATISVSPKWWRHLR